MDLATVIGAVFGAITVLVVMLLSGSLLMYWDFMSLAVVLGGALLTSCGAADQERTGCRSPAKQNPPAGGRKNV